MSANDLKVLYDVRTRFSIMSTAFQGQTCYTELKLTLQKLDKVIERVRIGPEK